MRWFIYIISIFNNAEQRVLIVCLYFSFINECKRKVTVWVCLCVLYVFTFEHLKILPCVLLMKLGRDVCQHQ